MTIVRCECRQECGKRHVQGGRCWVPDGATIRYNIDGNFWCYEDDMRSTNRHAFKAAPITIKLELICIDGGAEKLVCQDCADGILERYPDAITHRSQAKQRPVASGQLSLFGN